MKRKLERLADRLTPVESEETWSFVLRSMQRRSPFSHHPRVGIAVWVAGMGAALVLIIAWHGRGPWLRTEGEDGAQEAGPAAGESTVTRALSENDVVVADRASPAQGPAQAEVPSQGLAPRTERDSLGVIRGVVRDQVTLAPVPYACVFVRATPWGSIALEDGSFMIENLPPGTYDLLITMAGYGELQVDSLEVRPGEERVVDAGLTEEAYALPEILVQAQRRSIDMRRTATVASHLSMSAADDQSALSGTGLHFRGGRSGEMVVQGTNRPEELSPGRFQDKYRAGGKASAGRNRPPGSGPSATRPAPQSAGGSAASAAQPSPYPPGTGGNRTVNAALADDMFFEHAGTNPFLDPEEDSLSTFALDVDTGSYTITRRYLRENHLPPPAAVRVEEFVNYFPKAFAPPEQGDFRIHLAAMPAPFAASDEGHYYLVRVGIRGRTVAAEERAPVQAVLVIDRSGSMARENRLGAVKRSLDILLDELRPDDEIGIVAFSTDAQLLLPLCPVREREMIRSVVHGLTPDGSTNAFAGLTLAYELLRREARPGYAHRIILCSDGVANMEVTAYEEILKIVRSASDRIQLSTIGFGMGNYNDVLLEGLADHGDGQYAYVDDLDEAERVLRQNLTGALQLIARNAKVQVEFKGGWVERYRLLGYENRDVRDADFRNNRVDAGEIGAGHEVTALYEVKVRPESGPGRIATVRLRYEVPGQERFVEMEESISRGRLRENAPPDLLLDACVAEFAEILRRSYWAKESSFAAVLDRLHGLPDSLAGKPEVAEFIGLVEAASRLAQ